MMLRGDSEKYSYLGENKAKNEHILTHWSVAQAGSNYEEKNWGSKFSLDFPLNPSVTGSVFYAKIWDSFYSILKL